MSIFVAACDSTAPDADSPDAAAYAAAARNELFTEVTQPRLNPRQEALLATIRARPTTAEVRVARLSAAPAALLKHGTSLGITVSPGRRFVAVGERVVERGPQSISWGARLHGQGGAASLVLSGDGITGSVHAENTTYTFEPLGGGLQAIVRVDLAKFPAEHPAEHPAGALIVPPHAEPAAQAPRSPASPATGRAGSDVVAQFYGDPEIDLLVVYTPSAASAHGNIGALVQYAVDLTNTSYANSNVYANLVLAHSAQVSYAEGSATHQNHVDRLAGTSDGYMDNVHGLRNQYDADVVVLLVNDGVEGCGIAKAIRATAPTAFAIVDYGCISNFSFAHEVGHLQGARHDRFVDGSSSPYAYGHGYVDPNDQWRTIMAYGNACNNACQRINYWSNPYLTHPWTGQALGTTAYEDNARVLNNTKGDVRQFRTLDPPTGFTLTNNATGNNPYFTWNRPPGNPTTRVYRCISTGLYASWCYSPTGSDEEMLPDVANWQDTEYTIAGPYDPCGTVARYYVTAEDRTGESSYYNEISLCVN